MRLNIYIKDSDVLEHLNQQYNKSKYIVDLIRKDMNDSQELTREEIIELIREYAGDRKNTPDHEVQEAVKELFDW